MDEVLAEGTDNVIMTKEEIQADLERLGQPLKDCTIKREIRITSYHLHGPDEGQVIMRHTLDTSDWLTAITYAEVIAALGGWKSVQDTSIVGHHWRINGVMILEVR